MKEKKNKLTDKQIKILADIVRFKLLSTEQIANLHWDEKTRKSKAPANMMAGLKMNDFVTCSYAPLNASETKTPTRPMAIWFTGKKELKKIGDTLTKQGKASVWENIEASAYGINNDQKFAEQSLKHEVGISDVLIALEDKIKRAVGYEIVFALRTSPKHVDITQKIEIKKSTEKREIKLKVNINPDFFLCLKNPDKTYSFFFGEYDNDSSNKKNFFEKLEGYFVYQQRKLFIPVVKVFATRYGIPIKNFDNASFRVLAIVNSHTNKIRRRNSLFANSLLLPTNRFFNFATIDEWSNDPLGQTFLNKQVFTPLLDEYKDSIKEASPQISAKWFDTNLDNLIKDSIAH